MAMPNAEEAIQWQLQKTTVGQRIKHLYNNSLMADVHFVVADKRGSDHSKVEIPCHKFVLAVSSPVFFAMFYGELPELSESIDLPDCDSEGLLEFLRYIYCDEVQLTGSCVMQVLYLAKKYMIPSLAEHCRSFLEANINAENVLDVLPVVDKLEEANLNEICWEVVDAHAEEILQSASAYLLEDRKELLASILRRDSLQINEVKIFQAVNCWATDICTKRGLTPSGKEKRKVIGERVLRLIRFPSMSQKEFAEHVPDTEILTETENIQMFMYFSLNRKPDVFSCIYIPRWINSEVYRCNIVDKGETGGINFADNLVDQSIAFKVNVPILLRGVRLFGRQGETYFVKLTICDETVDVLEGQFQNKVESKDGYTGFDINFSFAQCRELTPGVHYTLVASISGVKSYPFWGSIRDEVICDKVTFRFMASHVASAKGQFAQILFTYPSSSHN